VVNFINSFVDVFLSVSIGTKSIKIDQEKPEL